MSNIMAVTYEGAKAVTTANSGNDVAGPFAGLLVTATGTLKFTTIAGDVITLSSTSVGQIIPIATKLVWTTGTSATVLGLTVPPYKGATNPGAGVVR
jgi:hypothetical protein